MSRNTFKLSSTGRVCALSALALMAAGGLGYASLARAQDAGAGNDLLVGGNGGVQMVALNNLMVVTTNLDVPDSGPTPATTNGLPVKKVVNGQFAVEVDNGWVIYQGFNNSPTLNIYDTDANGNFSPSGSLKIKPKGAGSQGAGDFLAAGGIVFAPCPQGLGHCQSSEQGSATGVGIGFGELIVQGGGQGSSNGGWVSDVNLDADRTNPDFNPGAISGLAVDPANGAYAVGWDLATSGFEQGIIWKLDAAGQTYGPVSETFLGTLGGSTSQVFGISKDASLVAGAADFTNGKRHAAYAAATDSAWTDLAVTLPAQVDIGDPGHTMKPILKSKALAANGHGFIAGSVTVHEDANGRKNQQVDIGFVTNLNTHKTTFFPFFGADIIPLKVLDTGKVVGNLEFVPAKTAAAGDMKSDHPFLFDGSSVTDFSTMTLATTGQPAYGCRINRPNNLGEVVGSCIPDSTTKYGIAGVPFYLNTLAVAPSFLNLNATVHANEDTLVPLIKPYSLGTATSIDDEDEVTLVGIKVVGGNATRASFLISRTAFQ